MKDDPELLKKITKYDEIEDLKNETEKHDLENILNSLKNNKDYFRKGIHLQIKRK